MPVDPRGMEDEELDKGDEAGPNRRFQDFDCPSCSANNPYDDSFGDGDEVLCYYCGQGFQVRVSAEGRLRLKEL
jgi:hypothetical protein